MRKIEIFDTTLRDGEQATQGFKYKDSKIEMALKLAEIGVDTIEAGFPKSSPDDFEAVSRIAKEVEGPYITGLARSVPQDIEPAWEAIQHSKKPTLHVFTYMVNKEALDSYEKSPENIMRESVEGVRLARSLVGERGRVEFSAQNLIFAVLEALKNEDQESLKFLTSLYGNCIAAGADIVNLPDTEGRVMPHQTEKAVKYMMEHVPCIKEKIVSIHCHNDLGMATANSLAAIRAGVTQVECAVNGIGERAGNTALEEVVMGIWTHREDMQAYTDVNTRMLNEISRMVSYHNEWDVQPNKAIVGPNAFRHSSGIHQDGNIKGQQKGRRVYEIFSKDIVGWTGESNQLTARSGKRGVKNRLDRLGYDIPIEEVEEKVMPVYTGVADERRVLDDIDLRAVMNEVYPPEEKVRYINHSGLKEMSYKQRNGRVKLSINGSERTSEWIIEEGEVDTLCTAVDSLIPLKPIPVLVDYDVRNVGKRHSAEAEVTIVLSQNGTVNGEWDRNVHLDKPVYIGRARDQDVPTASVMAYVKAINHWLASKPLASVKTP
ncbi:2-isopropylmalate synthase [Candidatus Woesearchaeota archaeon]|nr:2-isopropylmalate synthase [Candidatus Woesearchaeota archaeon]